MNIKITRKKIKNIIIRINENGEVLISAPFRTPNLYIENLIKEKESWIRKKLNLLKERKEKTNTFDEGEIFNYLGKNYNIEVKNSTQEQCELTEKKFTIYLKKNSLEKRKKLITQWVYNNFYPYMIDRTMELGESIGFTPKVIKFRDMKTRWGSCNTLTRSITFNFQLYKKPVEIIDYVILHELAHIPYPHHQKDFWNFVERYMPDWKTRRKLLREY